MSKPLSDYRRIKRAQAWAAARRERFRVEERLLHAVADAVKREELERKINASNYLIFHLKGPK